MLNIIKRELRIEERLKKKIEIICGFCNTKPTFINGSIRKIGRIISLIFTATSHIDIVETQLDLLFKNMKSFENIENLKTTYSKHYITEVAEKQIEKRDKQNILEIKVV